MGHNAIVMSVAEDTFAGARVRPIKREEFEKLCALGAFDDERVELLFGRIVEMSPPSPEHDGTLDELLDRLFVVLRDRARVRVQSGFLASDESLPLPDLAVVPRRSYRQRHPDEAFLIVEVSYSSLRKDRGPKALLYARAGVPEYWVVNVEEGVVEVHTEPSHDGYARVTLRRPGEAIALVAFPDVCVEVATILS